MLAGRIMPLVPLGSAWQVEHEAPPGIGKVVMFCVNAARPAASLLPAGPVRSERSSSWFGFGGWRSVATNAA